MSEHLAAQSRYEASGWNREGGPTMIGQLEVVRVIDGHVFDAECYERATISDSATPPASGFYVVTWPSGSTTIPFDASAVFAGPFATPEQANKALTEARSK